MALTLYECHIILERRIIMERMILEYMSFNSLALKYNRLEKILIAEYIVFVFDTLESHSLNDLVDGVLEYLQKESLKPTDLLVDLYSLEVFRYI